MRAHGDSELKIYGIFGFPLKHTASPQMQNAALDYFRLKAIYFAFECEPARFRFLAKHLKSLALDGFNLTLPFKEEILPYLNHVSEEAKAIGAVNTVKKIGKKWVGFNTDLFGFMSGLKEAHFLVRGKTCVVLGAGGASRTVLFALAKHGAKGVVVANRTFSRVSMLVREMKRKFKQVRLEPLDLRDSRLKDVLARTDLIVNTTKVGLSPTEPSPIPENWLPDKKKILVYDLIYRPRETKLLLAARRRGHKILNGESMLLYQGAQAFQIWTGKRAPISVMRRSLTHALRNS